MGEKKRCKKVDGGKNKSPFFYVDKVHFVEPILEH